MIRRALLPLLLAGLCSAALAQADEPATAPAEASAGAAAEGADAGVDGGAEAAPALLEGVEAQTDALTMVQVGLYVLRITNVSQRDGQFDIEMWLWFRWQGNEVRPYESFEIVNGTVHDRIVNPPIEDQGYNYSSVRVAATIYHQFDVRRFPFDDHVITLELEDSSLEYENLQFVADEGTMVDESVRVEGWRVSLAPPRVQRHVYPTTYGYRSLGSTRSSYSRFIVPLHLDRTALTPLFKLFWVSYLSVVLGLLAFRVRSNDLDARFGLGTGSVFAASANAFVVNEQLPQTTALTLAEQVNLLAVGTIFLAVFLSVASLRLRYQHRDEASERLDKIALVALSTAYVLGNVLILAFDLS